MIVVITGSGLVVVASRMLLAADIDLVVVGTDNATPVECPDFPAFDPPPLQCYEKQDIQYIEDMKHTYLSFAPVTQTVRRQGSAMRIVDNAEASGANYSKTAAIDY